MKKIVLLTALLLLATAGLHFASSYTGALVESPVFLRVDEQGMIALAPEKGVTVAQGEGVVAFVATNNMGVPIRCRLELTGRSPFTVDGPQFDLDPGADREIRLQVPADCPVRKHKLKVTLGAEFEGGRARVKASVSVTVTEAAATGQSLTPARQPVEGAGRLSVESVQAPSVESGDPAAASPEQSSGDAAGGEAGDREEPEKGPAEPPAQGAGDGGAGEPPSASDPVGEPDGGE